MIRAHVSLSCKQTLQKRPLALLLKQVSRELFSLKSLTCTQPLSVGWLTLSSSTSRRWCRRLACPTSSNLTMSSKKARKRHFHRSMSVSQTLRCFSTPAGPPVLRRAPCCHTVISWPTSCSSTVSLKLSELKRRVLCLCSPYPFITSMLSRYPCIRCERVRTPCLFRIREICPQSLMPLKNTSQPSFAV